MRFNPKNRNFLFVIIFIALTAIFAVAQERNDKNSTLKIPDFTGVWLLTDSTNSIKKNSDKNSILFLVITHQEPKLTIKKVIYDQKPDPSVEERVYFTDGRGEKFKTSRLSPNRNVMKVSINSKTKWSDSQNLVFENYINVNAPVGILRERLFEKWSLTNDGKALKVVLSFFDDNENQVYTKGDVAPSRFREWTETYKFLTEKDFENIRKN